MQAPYDGRPNDLAKSCPHRGPHPEHRVIRDAPQVVPRLAHSDTPGVTVTCALLIPDDDGERWAMVWTAVAALIGSPLLGWLGYLWFLKWLVHETGDARSLRHAAEATRAFWRPRRSVRRRGT